MVDLGTLEQVGRPTPEQVAWVRALLPADLHEMVFADVHVRPRSVRNVRRWRAARENRPTCTTCQAVVPLGRLRYCSDACERVERNRRNREEPSAAYLATAVRAVVQDKARRTERAWRVYEAENVAAGLAYHRLMDELDAPPPLAVACKVCGVPITGSKIRFCGRRCYLADCARRRVTTEGRAAQRRYKRESRRRAA